MELPSSRELELEALLRKRDTQLGELTDELTHLRQFSSPQPGPSDSDPVTLPPNLVSVLLPHLHAAPTVLGATSGSNTVNAALIQRAQILQEENDELYDLLKRGETGKLKEEVHGLRRVVAKLEGALRESHQVITSLTTELDKSYEALMASARATASTNNSSTKSYSNSPNTAYHPMSTPTESTGNGSAPHKLPPTGPRAYKKPRLSDTHKQQQRSPPHHRERTSLPPHKPYGRSHSTSRGTDTREYPPRRTVDARGGKGGNNQPKMEVDEDQRARPPSAVQERERGGRDRDRDAHRSLRRNGGGGGRGGRTRHYEHGPGGANDSAHGGDRTLRERMGL